MDLTIRMETPLEWEIVEKVVQESFQTAEHTDHKRTSFGTSIAGKRCFSATSLIGSRKAGMDCRPCSVYESTGRRKDFLALAPVSVLPEEQNQGIGSRLMCRKAINGRRHWISRCYCAGTCRLSPRFGYRPAAESTGINASFPVPDHCFSSQRTAGKWLKPSPGER